MDQAWGGRLMLFRLPRRQVSFEIPDEWWIEARMAGFRPTSQAYCTRPEPNVVLVSVTDIVHPPRIVEKDFGGFDRLRLIRILSGFVAGLAIPPIKVHEMPQGSFRYGLRDGFHRFYTSVAAGFDHIPAILTTYLPE
jgi:hypothetical protein